MSVKSASEARRPAALSPESVGLLRVAVIVVSLYIGAQMVADIASLKIGLVFTLAVDMGTFIYPITFTLRDVAHKVMGKRNTRVLIVMAAVVNLLMALYLSWSATVPSDPAWGLGEAYRSVLVPVWRIVIASIVAEVVSELIDTEVYHWFVTRITTRRQWLRVLVSNSAGIPVDNALFAVGAFGWTLPWPVVWQIFVFNLVIKYAVTLISMPLIYVTPDREHWDE
ncbi:MAG: queuosine precursor transporter [Caldilineaceae bacterium]|nr:queuosine precursor transporter [Caldilineaceae bacterium]